MPGHQLFGGATNEGEPHELMVEGSDSPRLNTMIREHAEERAGQPRSEEGKLKEWTHKERVRVVQFSLVSHLVTMFWPEMLLIRMSLGKRHHSDFTIYPDFGKYSPSCPAFYQNEVSILEFEGRDNVTAGGVWKWCQAQRDDLEILEAFEYDEVDGWVARL